MSSKIHPISPSKNTNSVVEIRSERVNIIASPITERNPMIEPTVVAPPQNTYDQNLQVNPNLNTYPQPNIPYNPTVQVTIHPIMPSHQPAQDMPHTPNTDDKPPESAASKHMTTLMAATYNNTNDPEAARTFNLPDQGEDGKQHVKKFVLMKKETTCCCGIFSIRLGIIGNLYRLFVAIVTLPFTIIAFIFTLISKMLKKCFGLCCKHMDSDDAYQVCYLCILSSNQLGYCSCICRLLDPEGIAKCCIKVSEGVAGSCDNCSDSCISGCTTMGGCCGKCCEFFGGGICGGLGFFQGLISSCLECGKGLYADCFGNCGSLLGKLCGFGAEYAGKCSDCASGCFGMFMQCQCGWDLCETVKNFLCSCGDIDFSFCSDCVGKCFSGSTWQFLECFQGVFCNLVEVLGGILSSLGKIIETIYDIVKEFF